MAAAVLHNTRAQSALLAPGPHVDALRDIMTDLMDLPEVNRYLSRLLSGVEHRYPLAYPADHPSAGAHCPPLTIDDTVPLDQLTTRQCIGAPVRTDARLARSAWTCSPTHAVPSSSFCW